MKKSRNRSGNTASRPNGRLFGISVTVLGIILIIMIILTVVRVSESFYYYEYSADELLRSIKNGYYEDVMWEVKTNTSFGNTAEKDQDMTVPYALSDYYEAETYYIAHVNSGDNEGASVYKDRMDAAYEKLGEFTFLADEIDSHLGKDN